MIDELLKTALFFAEAAGKLSLKYYSRAIESYFKSDTSIVTEADIAIDKFLVSRITEKFPDHGILSEESQEIPSEGELRWVIDPIDGSSNFSIHNPLFAVSIGILKNDDPIIGVVYAPAQKELYHAVKGRGAYLNSHPIHVDEDASLEESYLTFCNGRDSESRTQIAKIFSRLKKRNNRFRQMGVAALELCYVAAGRTGGFLMPGISAWDILGGALIVLEAGGLVSDFQGNPFSKESRNILASPKCIYTDLLTFVTNTLSES